MQEAVALVKREMGPDAMILQTRYLRRGWLWGLLGRRLVEVTAAVDKTLPAVQKPHSPAMPSVAAPELAVIKQDIQELKNLLLQNTQAVSAPVPVADDGSSLLQMLRHSGVADNVARAVAGELEAKAALLGDSPEVCRRLLQVWIKRHIRADGGIVVPATGTKIVAFIGPTGVGKTTTIAKLAADFTLRHKLPVALFTADTYRIAAVAQLKTYADIIGLPLEIVYNGDDLRQALARHYDKSLIFLDTAGRSPHNAAQLTQLRQLLNAVPEAEAYLVLSATTAPAEMVNIYERFAVCQPQKVIITKMDEAAVLGALVNLAYKYPLAVAYITTGQNVPDDIEEADADRLASLILREYHE